MSSINKKVYQKIVDKFTGKACDLGAFISKEIKNLENIDSNIKYAKKALIELEADFDTRKQSLLLSIVKNQTNCPHYEKTYHPDPSGNNDSSYECNLCGAEV